MSSCTFDSDEDAFTDLFCCYQTELFSKYLKEKVVVVFFSEFISLHPTQPSLLKWWNKGMCRLHAVLLSHATGAESLWPECVVAVSENRAACCFCSDPGCPQPQRPAPQGPLLFRPLVFFLFPSVGGTNVFVWIQLQVHGNRQSHCSLKICPLKWVFIFLWGFSWAVISS